MQFKYHRAHLLVRDRSFLGILCTENMRRDMIVPSSLV